MFGNLISDKNIEVWKPSKTLTAHSSGKLLIQEIIVNGIFKFMHHVQSDVCHIEWSADNAYLASSGFDNSICIWDTTSFGKLYSSLLAKHSNDTDGALYLKMR